MKIHIFLAVYPGIEPETTDRQSVMITVSPIDLVAQAEGFEPPTDGFGDHCSGLTELHLCKMREGQESNLRAVA